MNTVSIIAIEGVPIVKAGDDLVDLIYKAARAKIIGRMTQTAACENSFDLVSGLSTLSGNI